MNWKKNRTDFNAPEDRGIFFMEGAFQMCKEEERSSTDCIGCPLWYFCEDYLSDETDEEDD